MEDGSVSEFSQWRSPTARLYSVNRCRHHEDNYACVPRGDRGHRKRHPKSSASRSRTTVADPETF